MQMIVGDQLPAARILNSVDLEPRFATKFATIGDGLLERRKFKEIILAFARAGEHQ